MDYGFQVMGLGEASWDGKYHLVDNPINYMTGITPGIVAGKTYRLTLRVKSYSGGGDPEGEKDIGTLILVFI